MKKWLCLLSFFVIPLMGFSSEGPGHIPDSLLLKLHRSSGNDHQRAEALCDIIDFYLSKEDGVHAKPYFDDLVPLSESLNDKHIRILCDYYRLAMLTKENDFQSAVPFVESLEKELEDLGDDEKSNLLRVKVYSLLGRFYYGFDMVTQSFVELVKALKASERLNSEVINFNLNRRLMILYSSIGMIKEGIALGKKISGYKLNGLNKAYYYLSMSAFYNDLQCFDTAMLYSDSALMCDDSKSIHYLIYDFKSRISMANDDFDGVSQYSCQMQHELDSSIYQREDSLYAFFRISLYKAFLNHQSKRYDSALFFVNQSLETVKTYVSLEDECKIMDLKTAILIDDNKPQEALDNMMLTTILKDSLDKKKDLQNAERLVFQQKMAEYEAQQQYENYVRESKYRVRVLTAIIIALLFLACCVILVLVMKRRKMQHRMVEEELEERNREIASAVVVMKKKNEVYTEVINQLQELKAQTENRGMKKTLTQVSNKIEQTMDDDFYDEFDLRFRRVHPDFIEKLTKRHPDLTPNEIKICSFLKLNMSTKDIAQLTGQSVSAIEKARYHIRRKLGISLDEHAHLSQYIMRI